MLFRSKSDLLLATICQVRWKCKIIVIYLGWRLVDIYLGIGYNAKPASRKIRDNKPSLQTDDFIEEIITITTAATVPPYITVTERDYITLYIIRKDVAYGNILKRSKKSLKLNLKISLRTAFRSE